jgi:NosR/NirI family nitrous oxide reductase transcriptional regulator
LTAARADADNRLRQAGEAVQRFVTSILVVAALPLAAVIAQSSRDAELEAQLRQVFPEAVSFSEKQGSPPHYKAYGPATSGQEREIFGLVFWTTELDPLERGYDGPIKMLVGMDTNGILTRILVTDHREPYGYFSVEPAEFAAQFENKNIRDRFRVGEDIDAISRATVTVVSASRAVRNSARRAATAHLAPPEQ